MKKFKGTLKVPRDIAPIHKLVSLLESALVLRVMNYNQAVQFYVLDALNLNHHTRFIFADTTYEQALTGGANDRYNITIRVEDMGEVRRLMGVICNEAQAHTMTDKELVNQYVQYMLNLLLKSVPHYEITLTRLEEIPSEG